MLLICKECFYNEGTSARPVKIHAYVCMKRKSSRVHKRTENQSTPARSEVALMTGMSGNENKQGTHNGSESGFPGSLKHFAYCGVPGGAGVQPSRLSLCSTLAISYCTNFIVTMSVVLTTSGFSWILQEIRWCYLDTVHA